MLKQRRSPLAVIFLTVFLDLLGFGLVIPILPIYAKGFGVSDVWVTGLFSIYSVMQFVFAPIWGRLSDRVGRRPVLMVSIFGSMLSQLGYALAPSFTGLLVARAFAGMCGANIAAAQAYIADVTDEKSRASGMGMLGAAFGLGFIIGPAFGGFLSTYGDRVPFFAASGLALLNFILAALILKEPERHLERANAGAPKWSTLLATLRLPRLGVLITLFFILTFGFTNLEATFPLYLQRRFGYDQRAVAYLFTYVGVILVLVQGLLMRRLAAIFGERVLIVVGTMMMAAGMAMLAASHSLGTLLLGLGVVSVGNAVNTPSLSSLISRTAGNQQGTVLGVSQSAGSLARIIGPIAGGLWLGFGEGMPYVAGAVVIGAGCVFAASLVRQPEARPSASVPVGGPQRLTND